MSAADHASAGMRAPSRRRARASPSGAAGFRYEVLHRFCPEGGGVSCTATMAWRRGGPIIGSPGTLLGTTWIGGGPGNGGALCELKPDASRPTGFAETIRYRFCPHRRSCGHGANPFGGLIEDAAGNLYGVTAASCCIGSPPMASSSN
jgi:hypothetical protein